MSAPQVRSLTRRPQSAACQYSTFCCPSSPPEQTTHRNMLGGACQQWLTGYNLNVLVMPLTSHIPPLKPHDQDVRGIHNHEAPVFSPVGSCIVQCEGSGEPLHSVWSGRHTSSSVPASAFPLLSGALGPGWASAWPGMDASQKLSRASLSEPSVSPSPSFSSISTHEWGCSKYCKSRDACHTSMPAFESDMHRPPC